jgi:hypothetical protein
MDEHRNKTFIVRIFHQLILHSQRVSTDRVHRQALYLTFLVVTGYFQTSLKHFGSHTENFVVCS